MFTEFRQYVKNELKRSCLTYANLAESTGLRDASCAEETTAVE